MPASPSIVAVVVGGAPHVPQEPAFDVVRLPMIAIMILPAGEM
jgi:hypothetical protein